MTSRAPASNGAAFEIAVAARALEAGTVRHAEQLGGRVHAQRPRARLATGSIWTRALPIRAPYPPARCRRGAHRKAVAGPRTCSSAMRPSHQTETRSPLNARPGCCWQAKGALLLASPDLDTRWGRGEGRRAAREACAGRTSATSAGGEHGARPDGVPPAMRAASSGRPASSLTASSPSSSVTAAGSSSRRGPMRRRGVGPLRWDVALSGAAGKG